VDEARIILRGACSSCSTTQRARIELINAQQPKGRNSIHAGQIQDNPRAADRNWFSDRPGP